MPRREESAESILMCSFGTPVFSHFCPEAFGRRKRAVESGGEFSACAGDGRILRCPSRRKANQAVSSNQ